MSTIIMTHCWPLKMTASQKMVLISLADNANDDGWCWPGLEHICARTCLSERAVQNAFKALEAMGVLERHMRYKRSTIYRVVPANYRNAQPPERKAENAGKSAEVPPDLPRSSCGAANAGQEVSPADECNLTRRLVQSDPQELRAEPSIEPSIRTAIPARGHAQASAREGPELNPDDIASGRVQVDFSIPDWIPTREWLNYLHARAQCRKPTTPAVKLALQQQLRELVDQGQDARAVLQEATSGGWSKLYPVRRRGQGVGSGAAGGDADSEAEVEAMKARHRREEQREGQHAH